jgi:hypothetical protein
MIMTKICATVLVGLTAIILIMMGTDDGSTKHALIGGSLAIAWLITFGVLIICAVWGL